MKEKLTETLIASVKTIVVAVCILILVGVVYSKIYISDTELSINDKKVLVPQDYSKWTLKYTYNMTEYLDKAGYITPGDDFSYYQPIHIVYDYYNDIIYVMFEFDKTNLPTQYSTIIAAIDVNNNNVTLIRTDDTADFVNVNNTHLPYYMSYYDASGLNVVKGGKIVYTIPWTTIDSLVGTYYIFVTYMTPDGKYIIMVNMDDTTNNLINNVYIFEGS